MAYWLQALLERETICVVRPKNLGAVLSCRTPNASGFRCYTSRDFLAGHCLLAAGSREYNVAACCILHLASCSIRYLTSKKGIQSLSPGVSPHRDQITACSGDVDDK